MYAFATKKSMLSAQDGTESQVSRRLPLVRQGGPFARNVMDRG